MKYTVCLAKAIFYLYWMQLFLLSIEVSWVNSKNIRSTVTDKLLLKIDKFFFRCLKVQRRILSVIRSKNSHHETTDMLLSNLGPNRPRKLLNYEKDTREVDEGNLLFGRKNLLLIHSLLQKF